MNLSRGLLVAVFFGLVTTASVSAADKAKVLMLTQSQGFKHGSVNRDRKDKPPGTLSPAEISMTQLGQQSGLFDVQCTQDAAADFTKANLEKFDVVMFYTTGDLPISDADKDYFFKEWLPKKGHGFIGFHSALDTYHNYKPYWDMIGGTFDGHPVSWVKNYGDGRVFVTNLGHNESTWVDKRFLDHVTGGVKWILGQEAGDATPNPDVSTNEVAKARKDAGVAK